MAHLPLASQGSPCFGFATLVVAQAIRNRVMTAKTRMWMRTLSNGRASSTTSVEIDDLAETFFDLAGFAAGLKCDLAHEQPSSRGILRLRSRRELGVGVGARHRSPPMRPHVWQLCEKHAAIAILDGDARARRCGRGCVVPTPRVQTARAAKWDGRIDPLCRDATWRV